MEKSIQKWTVYGFLISFSLAILLVDYKEITYFDTTGYVTEYVPVFDYIVTIIRNSVSGGFVGILIGIFVGWMSGKRNRNGNV